MAQTLRSTLAATAAAAALFSAGAAHAGGFALKEGSTAAQGASFAGATAGGDDMTYAFFNPAALRAVDGVQIAFSNSFISPSGELDTSAGVFDGGQDAFLGAFYIGARVDERLVVGFSISAPFGLATEYEKGWVGELNALRTDLRTFAFTPMISYDVSDDFTVGAGVTYLYGDLIFENRVDLVPGNAATRANSELDGSGDAWGFRLGALWDVTPHATIGFAFKSGYNFEGDGELELLGPFVPGGQQNIDNVGANGDLPPVFSIGARFEMTESFTLLAEAQWQGWSSLDVFVISVPGSDPEPDQFGYEDAFYFALGGEFDATERLTLRSGVAWDGTPTVDEFRSPRIPDGDRIWLSAGASYQLTEQFKVDFAYSYLFTYEDTPVGLDTDSGAPGDDETADVEGEVHILSIGGSYEF